MNRAKTFGDFLIAKRMEREMSARQLAIKLDFSAVYICDIEKNRRPVPDEILEKLPLLLHLNEAETEEMYDLAARSRGPARIHHGKGHRPCRPQNSQKA